MDYEKKYNEALVIAKETYETQPVYRALLEKMFPELRESEDERIRKWMINQLSAVINTESVKEFDPTGYEMAIKAISYLEKQKEQKLESCDCSRDEESYINGIHHVLMNPEAYGLIKQQPAKKLGDTFTSYDMAKTFTEGQNYVIAHPEKFGLCKPAEWSEDYDEENLQTRFAFYTYKDDPSVLYLSNVFVEETSRNHGFGTRILKAAEKVAEAIGAITIRLKVKQDSPANNWYRKHGYAYMTFKDGYDWLEKNLEYMKPNKQEWSEEDKKDVAHIIRILDDCYAYGRHDLSKTDHENLVNKLKSLRNRVGKESLQSWKPSEKQMAALKNARYMMGQSGDYYDTTAIIDSLIKDLQKLL